MALSSTHIDPVVGEKIIFDDCQDSGRSDWEAAQGHEHAFRRVLADLGLDATFPIRLSHVQGSANVEISVFDQDIRRLSSPNLLIPIDTTSEPDVRVIRSTLMASIGQLIAEKEALIEMAEETWKQLQPMFQTRSKATLERIDFVKGDGGRLLLHARVVTVRDDLDRARSRIVAERVEPLVALMTSVLQDHDAYVSVMKDDREPFDQTRMSSLTAKVLELVGMDPTSLIMRVDADNGLGFEVIDSSLPFSSGRFIWSRGVLGCSLAMRSQNCWVDRDRVLLTTSGAIPETLLASSAGRPSGDFVAIEGLNFEARVSKVSRMGELFVIGIEMPEVEM